MRLRKRHAWGAILIALFALPVLKPEGIGFVERPLADTLTWPHRHAALRPGGFSEDDAASSAREHALLAELATVWERHLQYKENVHGLKALQDALGQSRLDRLPRFRRATILMAHDPVSQRRSITLNRGTEDGVKVGNAVVMGHVYLGRVREARDRGSIVQLVTDPRSRLEVFVRTTKNRLLRGYAKRGGRADGGDVLHVEFVQEREDTGRVVAGAPVFTANFDPRVPAHLLVGRVRHVRDPDLDRMPLLEVTPALDLDRSTSVVVLMDPGGPVNRPGVGRRRGMTGEATA